MEHYILVKWNEEVSDKLSFIPDIDKIFNSLLSIEGIHMAEVVPNVIDRENRYDLLIRITMDKSILSTYDESSPHHEWKEKYSKYIEKKAIFDCE